MRVRALCDVFVGGVYRAEGTEFNYSGPRDPHLLPLSTPSTEALRPPEPELPDPGVTRLRLPPTTPVVEGADLLS